MIKKVIFALFFSGVSVCFAQENNQETGYWVSSYGSFAYYHTDKSCSMLSSDIVNLEVKYIPSSVDIFGIRAFACKKCVKRKAGTYVYEGSGKQIQQVEKLIVAPKADIYAVKNTALEVSSRANLQVGSYYPLLQVARAQDMKLAGADIICQILERRKSNLTGAEGILRFRPICIRLTDGTEIQLVHDDVFLRGRNRSNVKWWLFPFLPVAGEGAKLDPNMEIPLYFK